MPKKDKKSKLGGTMKGKFSPQNAKGGYGSGGGASSSEDEDGVQRSIEASFEGLIMKEENNYFLTVQLQTTKVKQEGGLPPRQPMLTEKMRSDVCSNTKHPVFAKESFNLLFDGDVPLESIQLIAELNKVNDNGSGASRVGRSTVQLGGAKLMGSKKQLLTKSEYHDLNAHRRVRVQVQFHAPIPASVQGESNEFVAGQLIGEGTLLLLLSSYSASHPGYKSRHASALSYDSGLEDGDTGMDLGTAIGVQALGTWGWSWGWNSREQTKVRVAVHHGNNMTQRGVTPHCVVRAQIINNGMDKVRQTPVLTSNTPLWDEVLMLTAEHNEGSNNPARMNDSVSSSLSNRVGAAILVQVVAVNETYNKSASSEQMLRQAEEFLGTKEAMLDKPLDIGEEKERVIGQLLVPLHSLNPMRQYNWEVVFDGERGGAGAPSLFVMVAAQVPTTVIRRLFLPKISPALGCLHISFSELTNFFQDELSIVCYLANNYEAYAESLTQGQFPQFPSGLLHLGNGSVMGREDIMTMDLDFNCQMTPFFHRPAGSRGKGPFKLGTPHFDIRLFPPLAVMAHEGTTLVMECFCRKPEDKTKVYEVGDEDRYQFLGHAKFDMRRLMDGPGKNGSTNELTSRLTIMPGVAKAEAGDLTTSIRWFGEKEVFKWAATLAEEGSNAALLDQREAKAAKSKDMRLTRMPHTDYSSSDEEDGYGMSRRKGDGQIMDKKKRREVRLMDMTRDQQLRDAVKSCGLEIIQLRRKVKQQRHENELLNSRLMDIERLEQLVKAKHDKTLQGLPVEQLVPIIYKYSVAYSSERKIRRAREARLEELTKELEGHDAMQRRIAEMQESHRVKASYILKLQKVLQDHNNGIPVPSAEDLMSGAAARDKLKRYRKTVQSQEEVIVKLENLLRKSMPSLAWERNESQLELEGEDAFKAKGDINPHDLVKENTRLKRKLKEYRDSEDVAQSLEKDDDLQEGPDLPPNSNVEGVEEILPVDRTKKVSINLAAIKKLRNRLRQQRYINAKLEELMGKTPEGEVKPFNLLQELTEERQRADRLERQVGVYQEMNNTSELTDEEQNMWKFKYQEAQERIFALEKASQEATRSMTTEISQLKIQIHEKSMQLELGFGGDDELTMMPLSGRDRDNGPFGATTKGQFSIPESALSAKRTVPDKADDFLYNRSVPGTKRSVGNRLPSDKLRRKPSARNTDGPLLKPI